MRSVRVHLAARGLEADCFGDLKELDHVKRTRAGMSQKQWWPRLFLVMQRGDRWRFSAPDEPTDSIKQGQREGRQSSFAEEDRQVIIPLAVIASEPRPRVFLSSALKGLAEVRSELAARLVREGFQPFRFEDFRNATEWQSHTPAENEGTCLEEIDRADVVVSIFRSSYGRSGEAHLAGIGLTDLEFFHAFRAGKPIRAYLLQPLEQMPRELLDLVTIVKTLLPDSVVECRTESALYERVLSDLASHYRRRRNAKIDLRSATRRFLAFCERIIRTRRVLDDQLTGLRFLLDQYPAASKRFDPNEVAEQLKAVEQIRSHDARLAGLWSILQSLFAVPWRTEHHWLSLWDQCLAAWDKSAAWYGQHGFQYAGKLAADNTLLAIRSLRASNGEAATLEGALARGDSQTGAPEDWIRLYGTGGALGSEYYSVSKVSPARWRQHFLWKADRWCGVSERIDTIEEKAGLDPDLRGRAARASIRGQVRLALGDSAVGIQLLEDSLKWRMEAKLDADSTGWAQVALGHARYMNGDRSVGERMLEAGLTSLEQRGSPEFIVRGKKRLAHVRVRQWRLRDAAEQIDEALVLCETFHIRDQLADLDSILPRRVVRFLVRRPR